MHHTQCTLPLTRHSRWAATAMCITALCGPAVGQVSLVQVSDINATPPSAATRSSTPRDFSAFGNEVVFQATGPFGREIWRTNGSQASMVIDLKPGANEVFAGAFAPAGQVGTRLLFAGADLYAPPPTRELWSVDVASLALERCTEGVFSNLVPLGSHAVFIKDEPWRTDGTAAGTFQIADLEPGGAGISIPSGSVHRSGNRAFFTARTTAVSNSQFYVTDGTAPGTLGTLDLGVSLGPVVGATSQGAFASVTPLGLAFSDGTVGGTRTVNVGSDPFIATTSTVVGSSLFYPGAGTGPGTASLAISDGVTVRTVTLGPGVTQNSQPVHLTAAAPWVYFVRSGRDLWRSDGTTAGTHRIITFATETLDDLVGSGSSLFFRKNGALWFTDGTAPGTIALPAPTQMFDLFEHGGRLYFSADDGVHGREPWVSDGTVAGTHMIADLDAMASLDSDPNSFTRLGSRLIFVATTELSGTELFVTDGTAAGTQLLMDIEAGPAHSRPTNLTRVGDRVLFFADRSDTGRELWSTDGTPAGTSLVIDLNPGSPDGVQTPAVTHQGELYFTARIGNPFPARTLYRSDGTAAGTVPLAMVSGPTLENASEYASILGTLIVRAAAVGISTVPSVYALSPASSSGLSVEHVSLSPASYSNGLVALPDGSALFVDRLPGDTLDSLFATRGTLASTVLLLRGCDAYGLTPTPTGCYFGAFQPASGFELWFTDGTPAQTRRVTDIGPGPDHSRPTRMTPFKRGVLFAATTQAHGLEPYFSDGTTTGTVRLADPSPGPSSSVAIAPTLNQSSPFHVVGEHALLSLTTPATGAELWITDGSPGGTQPLLDVVAGVAGSTPSQFATLRDRVVLTLNDGVTGTELWALDRSTLPGAWTEVVGDGCAGTYGEPVLEPVGVPSIGNPNFALDIRSAYEGSPFALLVGAPAAGAPAFNGCRFWVAPPQAVLSAVTNSHGASSIPLQVPNDPGLAGLVLAAQAIVLDPGGALLDSFAFTGGICLHPR